ncbi:MAG TPA: hypothetical protein VFM83_05220, partial [Gaiellaceae bacterium]|nr:hypothetical protein [Gaiellaceae bacterium]
MAELRGEKVLLRPLAADDVPRLMEIQAQPAVARWWGAPTEQDLREKVDGTEGVVPFAIELDGEVVGLAQY